MDNISTINFQGNVYIMNGLSKKPKYYIGKAVKRIEKLVKEKNYNIYLKQDYAMSNVDVIVATANQMLKDRGMKKSVNITSGTRKYIDTVKELIEEYDAKEKERHEKIFKRKLQQDSLFALAYSLLEIPIMIIDTLKEDMKNIFNIIKSLQKKKG